jgi:hypothetical protein
LKEAREKQIEEVMASLHPEHNEALRIEREEIMAIRKTAQEIREEREILDRGPGYKDDKLKDLIQKGNTVWLRENALLRQERTRGDGMRRRREEITKRVMQNQPRRW